MDEKVSWWLRLPLVLVIVPVGYVVVLLLAAMWVICLPYFLIYPESTQHPYDFGDARQQEAVRRWRRACGRVSLFTRFRRLVGLTQGGQFN